MNTATLLIALLLVPAAEGPARPTLLDFHAEWCPPCKQMRPEVAKLRRDGVPIRSVDIDQEQELAARYKVTAVPAFIVVDAGGKALGRTEGFQPAAKLAAFYKQAKAIRVEEPVADEADEADPVARPEADPSTLKVAPREVPYPWQTVVRIKITIPGRGHILGSGTVISSDEDEAVVLTCAHIFKIDEARQQPSPDKFPRKIAVELFDGKLRQLKPAVVRHRDQETYEGVALDYDFGLDVGLIRIRPGRRIPASPVAPKSWKPLQGTKMVAVGCSEGRDATAWSTHISGGGNMVNNGKSYSAIECVHAPIEGRSGGGLYTEAEGYVVGVCDFADKANSRGLYAAPQSIYKLLDRNRLAMLYDPNAARAGAMLASNKARGSRAVREPSKLRAQSGEAKASGLMDPPSPEILGVRLPDEDGAAEPSAPKVAWREAAPRSGRPPSMPVRNRRPIAEPEADPAGPVEANLRAEPRAIDDGEGEAPPRGRQPRAPSPSATADAWQSAPRS